MILISIARNNQFEQHIKHYSYQNTNTFMFMLKLHSTLEILIMIVYWKDLSPVPLEISTLSYLEVMKDDDTQLLGFIFSENIKTNDHENNIYWLMYIETPPCY